MDTRISDRDAVYYLTFAARDGLERVNDASTDELIARWMNEEPHRTMLRRIVLESVHCEGCAREMSDWQLRSILSMWLAAGPIGLFREAERPPAQREGEHHGRGALPVSDESDGEPAPPPEPQIKPCDFAAIVLKCSHMPDADGRRTMANARFWREGGTDRNNLPAPAAGRARTSVIEVVSSHVDRGADDISITLEGGPGYTCGRNHPKVTIVDSARQQQVFEGQTRVSFKAKCRALPPPPQSLTNPFQLINYYFFPDQVLNLYTIDIEACGLLRDGRTGFGRSRHQVRAYPSDTYKLSLSIPSLKKTTHERGRQRRSDGTVEDSRSTTRTDRLRGETETSSRSESSSAGRLSTSETYSVATRQGGLSETRRASLDANNNLSSSTSIEHVDPVAHPAREAAATFKFERNGADIKGSTTIGELINAIVNVQNEIQSVMNFIRDFQPQAGWKFVFELELFKGELSYEWGYKEWEDHTAFEWWKFEVSMTLFSLMLELRFGAELKVAGVGITVLVFGNTSIDAKVSANKEATPTSSAPWELAVSSEPKGELGIRSALGADWVKAEGKLTCGFPFRATCKCSTDEPFHIDWQLDFTGVKAVVVGSVKFVGAIEREWTVIEPRKKWKTGRFPSGDTVQRPLRGRQGAIAAG